MSTDQFKINLNQNLWALVVSLLALGSAEYYCLKTLFWFGAILSGICSISLLLTLGAYTVNYVKNKAKKSAKDSTH